MQVDLHRAVQSFQGLLDSAVSSLPNLVIALIVFLFFNLLAHWSQWLAVKVTEKSVHSRHLATLLGRVFHITVFIVGSLVSLSVLFPTFRASDLIQLLGISSLAIGFAFKDIFQNFLAGFLILLNRPFQVGDQIVFGEYEGIVEDIQTNVTLLETLDHRRIVIPNTNLFTGSIAVTTAFEHRRAETTFGIDYDPGPDRAGEVITEALGKVDEVLKIPTPQILLSKITDGTINVTVFWWLDARSSKRQIEDRVLRTLIAALAGAQIKIKDLK
jgi:small conductance mechanosensitive channel